MFCRVKLEAVVTYSFGDDCQSNENVASYIWSDTEGVIPEDLKQDKILVLPPNTLPGSHVFKYTFIQYQAVSKPVKSFDHLYNLN